MKFLTYPLRERRTVSLIIILGWVEELWIFLNILRCMINSQSRQQKLVICDMLFHTDDFALSADSFDIWSQDNIDVVLLTNIGVLNEIIDKVTSTQLSCRFISLRQWHRKFAFENECCLKCVEKLVKLVLIVSELMLVLPGSVACLTCLHSGTKSLTFGWYFSAFSWTFHTILFCYCWNRRVAEKSSKVFCFVY